MSVAEIGLLHARYVRLSDKFKAAWTYHQFASGVFKNLLQGELPYRVDFQALYDEIRRASDVIQSAASTSAGPMMDRADQQLQRAFPELLRADQAISASVLRRFFDGLKRQDEKILFNIIKFYLYAGLGTSGDERDKLDFLFTRVGEDFVEERGEYSPKDTLELRKQFQGLVGVRPSPVASQDEMIRMIKAIRSVREEIQNVETFEQLTQADLLGRARAVKESLGEHFLLPDVLLAVVECNITAKNKFSRLYADEEKGILEESSRLLANEDAIARGFGESNPDLLQEMERFKQAKQQFDDSRARHDVKHVVITRLKASMNNILAQLDRGLEPSADETEEVPDAFLLEIERADSVSRIFGDDPFLAPYLGRIVQALEPLDQTASLEKLAQTGPAAALRLEPWEIGAFQKLYFGRGESDQDEVFLLYMRAAALRTRIEEQATRLSGHGTGSPPDAAFLGAVKASLDSAKQLDLQFKDFLHEGVNLSNPRDLHRLYRSRLRLLRAFSGLWLIYDLWANP
ncbi:MAG TPA: hypothetical protein VLV48_10710 [Thermoanaerobaculia bacterium]|nr:hypothetical protein [Thermoanaerobaculia bacterium]